MPPACCDARRASRSPRSLMLAIGIGVNVAAFGFLNAAFLNPLPVRDPDTLLRFERRAPDRFASDLPYPEVAFFRDYTRTLSAVLAAAHQQAHGRWRRSSPSRRIS